ncbi:hypothetical protein V8B97DRAFT_2022741 [Scleroderma yunnanense]
MFVKHNFGSLHPEGKYDTQELKDFLWFCDKYQCKETHTFIIKQILASAYHFHAAEIVHLSVTYHSWELFKHTFQHLLMGNNTFVGLTYAKAVLEGHYCIIAAEPPSILHEDDCQDPDGCEEDWYAVWWNGMGRFLLDGQNPQPYNDAIKHFKDMHFGHVSSGCKSCMTAFGYANKFVSDVCNSLAKQLIFWPPLSPSSSELSSPL